MRHAAMALGLLAVLLGGNAAAQRGPYRTLNDTFAPPEFTSLTDWNRRATQIRELILARRVCCDA